MDATTRELLLKARKGADAAFTVKSWETLLVSLGFGFETFKEGRQVTKIVITYTEDQKLVLEKDPRNKSIVSSFYKLRDFLRGCNYDLVAACSTALGMDTPEVERKLKALYVRDLTNTGTCPVCEGNFKREGTGMVHHGYTRPGDGMTHGSCFGVGHLPWECSPTGAEEYLKYAVRPHLENARHHLENLRSGQVKSFFDKVRGGSWGEKITVQVTRESDAARFEQLLRFSIGDTERDIAWTEKEILRLEKRISTWEPDELPEVKHAGKFARG